MAPSASAAANAVVEVTLPQAAADLAAAQAVLEAREAKIQSEIARNEAALAALRTKYKSRRGRYPNPDGKNKSKADANLVHLRAGRLPEEVRAANRAQHERIKNAPKPAASATSHAAHHAAAPDGRRCSGGGGAAAASAAPRGGQAAVDAAARGGGPDDKENDALPEGVDKRYFSASAAQQAFFAEVLPEARAGRGGRHLGSGYYAYTPPGCVELGGDMRTVGVSELIVFDPHRAFGCGHGCCPKHGWAERSHINTAGLTRTSRRNRAVRAPRDARFRARGKRE